MKKGNGLRHLGVSLGTVVCVTIAFYSMLGWEYGTYQLLGTVVGAFIGWLIVKGEW